MIQASQKQTKTTIVFHKRYWTAKQQIIYFFYVNQNFKRFISAQKKKQHKVFAVFSKFIKTRTPYQVKTRHQTILKRYKTLEKFIIQFLKENIEEIKKFLNQSYQVSNLQWNFLEVNFEKLKNIESQHLIDHLLSYLQKQREQDNISQNKSHAFQQNSCQYAISIDEGLHNILMLSYGEPQFRDFLLQPQND